MYDSAPFDLSDAHAPTAVIRSPSHQLVAPGGILYRSSQLGADLPKAEKVTARKALQGWYITRVDERRRAGFYRTNGLPTPRVIVMPNAAQLGGR